ncbi:selenide, water dikinase SelD [Pseudomonadota bacterium]
MKQQNLPVIKDLVLVGGGHSHVTVVKKFAMNPVNGCRLTLISNQVLAPYSGMLPGHIAGIYSKEEMHIDLGPLSRFSGARLYIDEVIGIDANQQKVICENRPPVSYDVLSINTGSTPPKLGIPDLEKHVIFVKPVERLLEHLDVLDHKVGTSDVPLNIGVVGAGAGGVELLIALEQRWRSLATNQSTLDFHLLTDTQEILNSHNHRVRNTMVQTLRGRNILIHTGFRVSEVGSNFIRSESGERLDLDVIFWVTGAAPASWLKKTELKLDDAGFIAVNSSLQSISHNNVFASGDVAQVRDHPRPKSGVFAVRQGPPLAKNLKRYLLKQPLKPFVPQRKFLSLLYAGQRIAVASRGTWCAKGRWVWNWKNWIDCRFMEKFNRLPAMAQDDKIDVHPNLIEADVVTVLTNSNMRCGGCGAKVGGAMLERVLTRLEVEHHKDVVCGMSDPDDAALVQVPAGKLLVQSVDFFRTFIDDPYTFGKIAANHALGDLYAMGATPQTALAIANVPYGLEAKSEETLYQMLNGATEILNVAGAELVGGHSAEGIELALGFSVNGLVSPNQVLRKKGMQPGDVLVLTKSLGTGTLLAADMRHSARGSWVESAIEQMLLSNYLASECLLAEKAKACTDVTGFGLLGHLQEMAVASEVDLELHLEAIPVLEGALETIGQGLLSTLHSINQQNQESVTNLAEYKSSPIFQLILDPQTAGGLLAALPAEHADRCIKTLHQNGYRNTSIVGTVMGVGAGRIRLN